jgi:signal transduction histidine kinase
MTDNDALTVFKKVSEIDPASKTCSTNLKLCLAQKLAEVMKGTITAHSEGKGKGSRFTLTLPLEM